MVPVKNRHVTIVGMGRTAVALARLLLREGAMPFVSDAENRTGLHAYKDQLEELGVPYECGNHSPLAFTRCEVVIPSPGVPPTIEPVAKAVRHGAALVSELDFAFAHAQAPVIAVTGTNGKTTTTELIAAMLRACGHDTVLAGNNAYPFSQAVLDQPHPDYFVLEVSSYQLETTRVFQPWIGVILNITEDHLGRHQSMEQYAAEKAKLFRKQSSGEIAIVNEDDPRCAGLAAASAAQGWSFSLERRVERGLFLDGDTIRDGGEEVASISEVRLPGRHNLANALAALTAVRAAGLDWDRCRAGLREFAGVEHRLEPVGTYEGVRYVNDSKSTNLDSLKVALESFTDPVVLIAGGRGKGGDYAALAPFVRDRVRALVAIGEDAPEIEMALGKLVATLSAASMEEAVALARDRAAAGDIILFSPGCASFDWYANFEERGRAFKRAVKKFMHTSPVVMGA